MQFLTKEDEKEETYEDFDFFLYTKLMDARDLIFKILQDRSLDMQLRMAEVLALAHDLQRRVRDNVLYQTDALFENIIVPEEMVISKKNWRELQDTAVMK